MKQNLFSSLLLSLGCTCFYSISYSQFLSVESKDSLNGKPRIESKLIGRLKLNGLYDISGSLAEKSAFSIHENDVSGKDIPAFNMDMRQSQLRFISTMQLKNGKQLKAMLEGDFIGPNNTSQFRLRHAWIEYEQWMAGQNWSTFGSGSLWPASLLDWDGPTGMVLSRRTQVRYTSTQSKALPVSIEASIEYTELRRLHDYTINPDLGVDNAPSRLPDAVLGVTHHFKNGGFVKAAGLYRNIGYNSKNMAAGETDFNYSSKSAGGVTLIANIFFEKSSGLTNNLQAQWTTGKGIADYLVALGGSGLDGFANSSGNGTLNLLPVHAGFISYQRYWTKKFHTMGVASYNHFYDAGNTASEWDKMTNYYAVVNVGYDLLDSLMVALETQVGYKELEYNSGEKKGANAVRIGFGILYNF